MHISRHIAQGRHKERAHELILLFSCYYIYTCLLLFFWHSLLLMLLLSLIILFSYLITNKYDIYIHNILYRIHGSFDELWMEIFIDALVTTFTQAYIINKSKDIYIHKVNHEVKIIKNFCTYTRLDTHSTTFYIHSSCFHYKTPFYCFSNVLVETFRVGRFVSNAFFARHIRKLVKNGIILNDNFPKRTWS